MALVAIVVGCGWSTPQAGAATPTPPNGIGGSPATSPSASALAPRPVPSPTTQAPVPVRFVCKLPFVRGLDGTHGQAGFVSFPAGTFDADPQAPPQPGYYDLAVRKWLPVGRQAVAPDGLHYAAISGGLGRLPGVQPSLHIVDAATGGDRTISLALPADAPYGVVNFSADGVYIESGWEGSVFGYWRIDPATSALVALGTGPVFWDDGSGYTLRAVFDRQDPKPALSGLSGDPRPNEIVRRDLGTGAEETWFYRPGFNVSIGGTFLSGAVLVAAEPAADVPNDGTWEYWLVAGPLRSSLLGRFLPGQGLADSHGIWIATALGLYLFTAAGTAERVSELRGYPANGCG